MKLFSLCAALLLCDIANASPEVSPAQGDIATANADGCAVCTFVVSFAEKLLDMGEPMVERELKSLCSSLGAMATMCDTVVAQLPTVVKMLEDAYPPKWICAEMTLCANGTAPVTVNSRPAAVKHRADAQLDECTMCRFCVEFLEQLLNTGEESTEAALTKLCTELGISGATCKVVLSQLPLVIHYLEQQFPSQWICHEIDLCKERGANVKVKLTKEGQQN